VRLVAVGVALTVCGVSLASTGHPTFACGLLVWLGGVDLGFAFAVWANGKARGASR
jgi:hypothetical protein